MITPTWESVNGVLYLFENDHEILGPIPVVIGRNGMAWGIGLHTSPKQGPFKKEGDGKAPAGIFNLGVSFGLTPREALGTLNIPYLEITPHIEAIDDPHSIYYNQIVDVREVNVRDWNSSEKMSNEPLYQRGLVIHHNPLDIPEKGSAIFMHVWPKDGTAGCTAMDLTNMDKIIHWLDSKKNPILIQLPFPLYKELQKPWQLPVIK